MNKSEINDCHFNDNRVFGDDHMQTVVRCGVCFLTSNSVKEIVDHKCPGPPPKPEPEPAPDICPECGQEWPEDD